MKKKVPIKMEKEVIIRAEIPGKGIWITHSMSQAQANKVEALMKKNPKLPLIHAIRQVGKGE
jgi:hypothetical protein